MSKERRGGVIESRREETRVATRGGGRERIRRRNSDRFAPSRPSLAHALFLLSFHPLCRAQDDTVTTTIFVEASFHPFSLLLPLLLPPPAFPSLSRDSPITALHSAPPLHSTPLHSTPLHSIPLHLSSTRPSPLYSQILQFQPCRHYATLATK